MDQTTIEAEKSVKKQAGRPPNQAPISGRQLAKVVQLGISVDLLGSVMSLSCSRGNELVVDTLGIKAISKKTGRVVLIPWSNVRGCELFPEDLK